MVRSERGAQLCGAVFGVAMIGCVLPAGAAADEELVRRYYEAIEAAEECEHRQFDQVAHENMAAVINERGGGSELPFVERMAVITDSRDEARDVIFKFGCKSDKVAEMLKLFHSDLEPAL